MHTEAVQSAQIASSRAEAGSGSSAPAFQAPAYHRSSLQTRAAAAVAAAVVSATTLGAVLTLFGSPDGAATMAYAVRDEQMASATFVERMESAAAPGWQIRTRIPAIPCRTRFRQCG